MPEARSWVIVGGDGSVTSYSYVQSDAGNYAIRTKKVGDILGVVLRPSIGAGLDNTQVEALFAGV